MAVSRGKSEGPSKTLSERQEKWFAAVKANLKAETGKTLEEWAAIAKTCPETAHKKRLAWLKAEHGLGVNRASGVLALAFGEGPGWDEPEALVDQLFTDLEARAIYEAVCALAEELEGVVIGPRKTFVSFSRKVQFAAIRPVKSGGALLGLKLAPEVHPRFAPTRREPWSEKNTAVLTLTAVKDVDAAVKKLFAAAAENG